MVESHKQILRWSDVEQLAHILRDRHPDMIEIADINPDAAIELITSVPGFIGTEDPTDDELFSVLDAWQYLVADGELPGRKSNGAA